MVALPLGHPLARASTSRFDELASEDLIAYRENSALRRRLEREMADRGLEPRNAFICTEMGAVRALASKGLGVAVIPRSVAEEPGPPIELRPIGPEPPDLADRARLARRPPPDRRRARRSSRSRSTTRRRPRRPVLRAAYGRVSGLRRRAWRRARASPTARSAPRPPRRRARAAARRSRGGSDARVRGEERAVAAVAEDALDDLALDRDRPPGGAAGVGAQLDAVLPPRDLLGLHGERVGEADAVAEDEARRGAGRGAAGS